MRSWPARLSGRWAALRPRERTGLQWATACLGLFLLWTVALKPALRTLNQAQHGSQRLVETLQHMHALQAQAKALQQIPARSADWQDELARSIETLGPARLGQTPEGLQLNLQGSTPHALGSWLAELGPRWRVGVRQASLQRDAQGLWHGQIWLETR